MANKKKLKPPKAGAGDIAHAVVRTGLSFIPDIGGPAAELFTAVITPPLEKRRQEWMEEVWKALKKLEQERGVKLEELKKNDTFIDAVMQASQAALRNSQQAKRRALRNTVLNAALPNYLRDLGSGMSIDLLCCRAYAPLPWPASLDSTAPTPSIMPLRGATGAA